MYNCQFKFLPILTTTVPCDQDPPNYTETYPLEEYLFNETTGCLYDAVYDTVEAEYQWKIPSNLSDLLPLYTIEELEDDCYKLGKITLDTSTSCSCLKFEDFKDLREFEDDPYVVNTQDGYLYKCVNGTFKRCYRIVDVVNGLLTIDSVTDACLFINADTDNVDEEDAPSIVMTKDGKNTMLELTSVDINNDWEMRWGNTNLSNVDAFKFVYYDTIVADPPSDKPVFDGTRTEIMDLGKDVVNCYTPLNMQDNDIINVNNLSTDSLKVGVLGDTITAPNTIHMQSNGDAVLWLQADRNDNTGNARIYSTTEAGEHTSLIYTSPNTMSFYNGGTVDNTEGNFCFVSQRFNNTGDSVPTVNGPGEVLFCINNNTIELLRETDLNGNNLWNVGDIALDSITKHGSGNILVNDTIDMTDKNITNVNHISADALKLSNVNDIITEPNCLHVQNTGDACLWLQADTDNNSLSDNPKFIVSREGGDRVGIMAMGVGGDIQFATGNTTDNTSGVFSFFSSQFNNNGQTQPTLSGGSNQLVSFSDNTIELFRETDLNGNNLWNVGDIALDSITKHGGGDILVNDNVDMGTNQLLDLNAPLDNTSTRVLALDTNNNVVHRTEDLNIFGTLYQLDTGDIQTIPTSVIPGQQFIFASVNAPSSVPNGTYKVSWTIQVDVNNVNDVVEILTDSSSPSFVEYLEIITGDVTTIVSGSSHITNPIIGTTFSLIFSIPSALTSSVSVGPGNIEFYRVL